MEILTLGEKVRKLRKAQNMTLKDLAGDKVTAGQISLVESGKSKPSLDLLEYISQKMHTSIDYFIETEEHQAEKLCDYYSKIAYSSLLAQNYDIALEAISKSMKYAEDYNLEYYRGLNELYAGMIDYNQGDFEKAEQRFISSNESFLNLGKFRDALEAYINLGLTAYKLSHYNSSLNYFKQAEKLMKKCGLKDEDINVKIFFNMSMCYSMLDNNQASVDYALLAMESYNKKNDKFQYGQTLLMLSLSCNNMDKQEEALMYADKAVRVFKDLNEMSFVAGMETNIGMILTDIGSIDESMNHLENACRIKKEINDRTLPYTMFKMADNYIKMQDTKKALDIVNQINNDLHEGDNGEYRVFVYFYFYKLYLAQKDYNKAELSLMEAVRYLKNLDMPKQLADMYIMLGDYYRTNKKDSDALEYYTKGIEIYKKLGVIH